jgi:hydroxyacylglutathione hydrolase
MDHSLTYLGNLPNNTVVNNGHEYTRANLAFARSVDPTNKALERLATLVENHQITAGLTTIGDEKEWNVFMRLDSDTVRRSTSASGDTPASIVMQNLRDLKNEFKGCNAKDLA